MRGGNPSNGDNNDQTPKGASITSLISPSSSTTAASVSNQLSNSTRELLSKFDKCTSVDDVFRLAEEIPAIRRSPDKMQRISWAKEEDAILAANAIQRLATIYSHPQYVHPMQPFVLERRFEVRT